MNRFSVSNSVVFAQYFLTAFEVPITPERQTITALVCLFLTISRKSHGLNHWSSMSLIPAQL